MQSSIDLQMASQTYQNTCQKLHYLVARQRELCGLDRNILQVGVGAEAADWPDRRQSWEGPGSSAPPPYIGGGTGGALRHRAPGRMRDFNINPIGVAWKD